MKYTSDDISLIRYAIFLDLKKEMQVGQLFHEQQCCLKENRAHSCHFALPAAR